MTRSRLTLAHSLSDDHIGLEARAQADDHLDTRMWLRLLACSNQIEQEIRQRLRQHFGTTLPRFDYLAQLERHPDGLRMNVLSRYLMVTGGNVTGVTDQLVADGLVERFDDPEDRRSWRVQLTPAGRELFARMAKAHEAWLAELFGGMGPGDKQALYGQLGRLRVLLARQQEAGTGPTSAGEPLPTAVVRAGAAPSQGGEAYANAQKASARAQKAHARTGATPMSPRATATRTRARTTAETTSPPASTTSAARPRKAKP